MPVDSGKLLKPREFCGLIGISYRNFKWWVSEGRIHIVRTPTGRIRVPYSEVEHILGEKPEVKETRATIYTHVSSND